MEIPWGFQDEEYLKELVTTCTKKAPHIPKAEGLCFEMFWFPQQNFVKLG